MERESQSASARLIARLGKKLPQTNFYRFCQLLEQIQPERPVPGSDWRLQDEPIRFRPHPGMGFPVAELKSAEQPEESTLPPTVSVTFMGLYGIESPLPTAYIDDIACGREGYEAVSGFLDIFNHRMISQFYRIWRKYNWPATFQPGGTDTLSRYLLSLAGLGVRGCLENVATPASRFLALSGLMRLPGRPAEGLVALVRLLAPDTVAEVVPHDPLRIALAGRLPISAKRLTNLASRPVMGSFATDVNSQILLRLSTTNVDEAKAWLPGGQLHSDLLALLHVWLGARLHVRMTLSLARSLLPNASLSCRAGVMLGRTAVLRRQGKAEDDNEIITIGLGRYQRFRENYYRRKTDEQGDYRW